MLKHFASQILRDDKPAEGGDNTPAPKPTAGVIQKPSITREAPKSAVEGKTFSVDEFEPEQLPVHENFTDAEGKPRVEEKKKDDNKTKEGSDKDGSVVGREQPKKDGDTVVAVQGESKESKDKEKEEKKSELPSFIKPPASKQDDKKDDKEKKEVIKQINPGKITRDYSGHTPEEVAAFKAMSDESYAFTKKIIQQNKELDKLKDTTYLQHEKAYLLDPKYNDLIADRFYHKKEGDIWAEQLALMKAGKKWRVLEGFDKNGNPQYEAGERDPNDQHEEQVRRMMHQAYQNFDKTNGEIQAYPSKYQAQTKNDLQIIEEERKKRFAWVANPELLDYSMHVEGLGDRTFRQMREDFISLFPPYLSGNPGVQVAADLMIALRYSQAELELEKNKNKVADINKKEESRGEPSSDARQITTKKPVHGVTEFREEPI